MQPFTRESHLPVVIRFSRPKKRSRIYAKPPKALGMAAEAHTAREDAQGTTPLARTRGFEIMAYSVMVAAIVTSVLTLALAPLKTDQLTSLALLGALLVLSDLARQNFYGDNFSSPGTVAVLAVGGLVGLPAVVLLEAITSLVGDATRRSVNFYTFYNSAVYLIAGVASSSLLFFAMGHGIGGFSLLGIGGVAGLVYYAINVTAVTTVTALSERRKLLAVFRESTAWFAPHYAVYGILAAGIMLAQHSLGFLGIVVFAMPGAAMLIATGQYIRATEGLLEKLRTKNQTLEALLAENRGLLASLSRGHMQLIRGLAQSIDAKDPYTAGHTSRVAQYSVRIASALGLDDATRREIEHGALLHDIGKIGVPDAVLTKPGPLDDDEWAAMRQHPLVACAILDGVDLSPTVISMVRHHHENLDGTGYPDHLAGDELPVAARIARVADAFDAMTSDRPYRDALSLSAARSELRKNKGSQFCPDIVDVFEDLIERGQLDRVLGQLDSERRLRSA
jgi:putative nucleotidyltransferase with HDIG domain